MHKKIIAVIFSLYTFLGLIIYSPVIKAFFVSDDFDWLWRSKNFSVATYFLKNVNGSLENGVYRPLTSLSFWLEYKLYGLNPIPYHLANIILLSLTACLIFALLRQLSVRKSLAFLAGLFFIILPNHPEAVSWISGRGDVLATFFYLASLILYIHFRKTKKIWAIIFSLAGFALALLSKEMAMTLPGVIVLYEVLWQWPEKEKVKDWLLWRFIQLSIFAGVLATYFIIRWETTKTFFGFYASAQLKFNPAHSLRTLFATLFSNFTDRRLQVVSYLTHHKVLLVFCFLLAFLIIYVLIKNFSKGKSFIFGIGLFLIGSLPIISLSYNAATSEGERFAYLPSAGIAICLSATVIFLLDLARQRYQKVIFGIIFVLIGGYLAGSLFIKNLAWREAGDLSKSLLVDLGNKVDLSQKQGVVILGLPDNLAGAQVLRNGWLHAVGFIYPNYKQDMLAVKVGFNLVRGGSKLLPLTWKKTATGFKVVGPPDFFTGTSLESFDYKMSKTQKNSMVEFSFTPDFFDNLKVKPLVFLKETGSGFAVAESLKALAKP